MPTSREDWKSLLKRHPICTNCKTNPHSPNSQWCRACINARAKIRRKENAGLWYKLLTPEARNKRKARSHIHFMTKRGKMERKPCEVCGNSNSQGHHYLGYDRENFKKVRWLCLKHHREEEKRQLTEQVGAS